MAGFDFIVPFRAKSTTEDWESCCALLQSTLKSLCNTPGDDYRVIIICHEYPEVSYDRGKCLFLKAAFPPPDPLSKNLSNKERIFCWHTDKGRKLLQGIERSKLDNSRYFMPFDADDLVSADLVPYCLKQDNTNGYFIMKGYRTDPSNPNLLFYRRHFFHECGSCNILGTHVAPFPEKIDYSLDFDDYFVRRYVVHAYVTDCMASQGTPIAEVPFPAVIYRFHSENIYANSVRRQDSVLRKIARRLFRGVSVTPKLREKFSIY